MATITIPQKEYKRLLDKALRYEYLREILEEDIFSSPPVKSSRKIIAGFQRTKLYNQEFLKSLTRGLKRSSYFRK